jgi:hypothetical protein
VIELKGNKPKKPARPAFKTVRRVADRAPETNGIAKSKESWISVEAPRGSGCSRILKLQERGTRRVARGAKVRQETWEGPARIRCDQDAENQQKALEALLGSSRKAALWLGFLWVLAQQREGLAG